MGSRVGFSLPAALFVFLECTAGTRSPWQVEFQPATLLHAFILLQQPTAELGLKCPRCQGLGLSDGTGNGLWSESHSAQ